MAWNACFPPSIYSFNNSGYNTAFKNDIKNVLQVAGVAGEPIVLVLEDHQLVQPTFVEYVNSLLAGIFTLDLFSSFLVFKHA